MRRLNFTVRFLGAASWAIWILLIAQIWSSHKVWRMINDHDMTSTEGVVDMSYRFKTMAAHYAYHYLDTIPATQNIRYYSSPEIFMDYDFQPVVLGELRKHNSPLLFVVNPSLPMSIASTNKVFFLSESSYLIFLVLLFLVLRWLIEIFKRMKQGEYFTRKQYGLVNRIGFTVIAIPISDMIIRKIVMTVVTQNTLTDLSLGSLYSIPTFDFPIFFVGVAIIILAEAFKYGLDLQHDQSLTI